MASKRSLDEGCGITNDLMCVPCSKRGNRVKAVKFCEDCLEYLCSGCVHDHNKFGIMNGHKLLNDVEMRSLRTDPCKFHPRNMIDRYCWYHDAACCHECKSENHSMCIGVDYLPTAVKRMKTSSEYKNIMSSMQDIKLKLRQTKKEQEADLERIEQEKGTAICKIQETTNKMINYLTDLEKKEIDVLCSRYQKQEDKTNENINVLDARIKSVEEQIQQIHEKTSDGEIEQFIFANDWKDIEESCRKQLKTIQTCIKRTIEFKANSRNERMLNITSLGELTEENMRIEYTVFHHGDYNLGRGVLDIQGACQLDDGTIVVADSFNDILMRLDRRYKVRDRCMIPGLVHSSPVCTVGTNEVAVAGLSKVHFVTIGRTMSLSRSFGLEFGYYVGICYMADNLLVGGISNVRVYSKAGTPLRTIRFFSQDNYLYSCIRQVVGSANNNAMYVVTADKNLFSVDVHIESIDLSSGDAIMERVHAVCEGPNGQLFVVDTNNTIFCISSDGLRRKVLLMKDKDTVSSLFYDKINHRLIVVLSFDCTIKVYDVLHI